MTTIDAGLNTYTDIAHVLTLLPVLLREARRARRLSLRAAAEQIGCSFNTLYRVEAGEECVLSTAVAVIRWLDQPDVARPDLRPEGGPA